jgi:uncharacterized protein YeaO (DUF488 family)
MPIKIDKHARQYRMKEDGTRILITRWWPRGVQKDHIDKWYRELAPSSGLLNSLQSSDTEPNFLKPASMDPAARWEWFTERYETEMENVTSQKIILDLRERQEHGEVITLLCACHRSDNCHRSILARLILGNGIPKRGANIIP